AFRVWTEAGPVWAKVAGKLIHAAEAANDRSLLPAVGDFVLLNRESAQSLANVNPESHSWHRLEAVLPRRRVLRPKAPGTAAAAQLIAANVDVVFLVNSFNRELNARRLERYLLLAWDGGAVPVVLLTKIDLGGDLAAALALLTEVALGAPVLPVSAVTG